MARFPFPKTSVWKQKGSPCCLAYFRLSADLSTRLVPGNSLRGWNLSCKLFPVAQVEPLAHVSTQFPFGVVLVVAAEMIVAIGTLHRFALQEEPFLFVLSFVSCGGTKEN